MSPQILTNQGLWQHFLTWNEYNLSLVTEYIIMFRRHCICIAQLDSCAVTQLGCRPAAPLAHVHGNAVNATCLLDCACLLSLHWEITFASIVRYFNKVFYITFINDFIQVQNDWTYKLLFERNNCYYSKFYAATLMRSGADRAFAT